MSESELEHSFKEMNLQIGIKLQLTLTSGANKTVYYSSLIGYEEGEYLLVKIPKENGFSVPVLEGEKVQIRVFSQLSVYTFETYVQSFLLNPRFYMHLNFPKEIYANALREAVRAKVNILAKLTNQSSGLSEELSIRDLSISGALIAVPLEFGNQEDKVELEFEINANLTGEKTKIRLLSIIKNKRAASLNEGSGYFYGLGFIEIERNLQFTLQNFIYENLIFNSRYGASQKSRQVSPPKI